MRMVYRFGQLFDIIDGDRGKNYPGDSDFLDEGYCLFLNAGNVTKNGWSFESNSFITKEKDEQLRKGRVNRGDTVFTTRGTVGNAAYYSEKVLYDHMRINSGMVILRAKDNSVIDSEFIYYLVTSPLARKTIELYCSGSAQPQLPIKDFVKIKYDLPSINRQRQIVSVISAFDNLIDINNKRIRVLEQMAENLYKEWFVRFRFPGHETAEFENDLPKGWMLKRADEVITFNPNLAVKDQTQFTIIPMEALSTTSMVLDSTCFVLQDTISGRRSQNGDTLLAKITPCLENGKTGFVMGMPDGEVFGGSTEFVVMRSKALNPYYVYWLARSYYFRQTAILSMNGADGRQRVDEDKLKSMKIIQPSKTVLEWFERIIAPVFDEINTFVNSNISLSKQRDLLLPRLMSGRMEVNLEEHVNE